MVRLCFTFTFLIFIENIAVCQSWRPARVVRTAGDTLAGEVRFNDPDISPTDILFRADQKSTETILTTGNVVSFRLDDSGQIFQPLQASIETLFLSAVPVGESPVSGKEAINVFAEVLVIGPDVKLYLLYDTDRREHFFVRKGSELTELIFRKYEVQKDGKVYNAKAPLYKGQLKQVFSDCPEIQKPAVEYNEKSLTRFVNSYISCKGGSASFSQKYESAQLGFGGTAGYLLAINTSNGQVVSAGAIGLTGQLLSRKSSGNRFVWFDLGALMIPNAGAQLYAGALVGSYFGKGKVRPLLGAGLCNLGGLWQYAAGVGVDKKLILSFLAIPDYPIQTYFVKITAFPFRRS